MTGRAPHDDKSKKRKKRKKDASSKKTSNKLVKQLTAQIAAKVVKELMTNNSSSASDAESSSESESSDDADTPTNRGKRLKVRRLTRADDTSSQMLTNGLHDQRSNPSTEPPSINQLPNQIAVSRTTTNIASNAANRQTPPTDPLLVVGEIWRTFWSLLSYVSDVAKQFGFGIVRHHTACYKPDQVAQIRASNPDTLIDEKENNCRSGTLACSGSNGKCCFGITFKPHNRSKNGEVVITKVVWEHCDHPLTTIGSLTLESQLSGPELCYIAEIAGTSMKNFRELLTKKFQGKTYDNDLLYRLRNKAKVAKYGPPGSLQQFLDKMHEMKLEGGRFVIEVDETGTIMNMFVQLPTWREYALKYDDYVLVDGTFNVTTYPGVVMLTVGVVDALNHTVIAGVAFIPSENADATARALDIFGLNRKGTTLHSDGALAFAAVAQRLAMNQRLCAWHWVQGIPPTIGSSHSIDSAVAENDEKDNDDEDDNVQVPSYVRKKKGKSELAIAIENLVWDELGSPAELDEKIADLRIKYAGNAAALKLIERLHTDRERVTATYTMKLFSAGHSSQSRIEGQFAVIKKDITPNEHAVMRYPELVEHVITVAKTRSQNSQQELLKHLERNKKLDWTLSKQRDWDAHYGNIHQYSAQKMPRSSDPGLLTRVRFQVTKTLVEDQVSDAVQDDQQWIVDMDELKQDHAVCSCSTFTSTLLPCEHICCVLITMKKKFDVHMIAKRWRLTDHPEYEACRAQLATRVGQPVTQVVPSTQRTNVMNVPRSISTSAKIPVSRSAVQREAILRKLLDRVTDESKRSLGHFGLIVQELTGVLNRSAAAQTSVMATAAANLTDADADGDAGGNLADDEADADGVSSIANSSVERSDGLEPVTNRQGGRPKKQERTSKQSLGSIRNSNVSTEQVRSSEVSDEEDDRKRCGACRKKGHQSNNAKLCKKFKETQQKKLAVKEAKAARASAAAASRAAPAEPGSSSDASSDNPHEKGAHHHGDDESDDAQDDEWVDDDESDDESDDAQDDEWVEDDVLTVDQMSYDAESTESEKEYEVIDQSNSPQLVTEPSDPANATLNASDPLPTANHSNEHVSSINQSSDASDTGPSEQPTSYNEDPSQSTQSCDDAWSEWEAKDPEQCIVVGYDSLAPLRSSHWNKLSANLGAMLQRRGGLWQGQCGAHAFLTAINGSATHEDTNNLRKVMANRLIHSDGTPSDDCRWMCRKIPGLNLQLEDDLWFRDLVEELSSPTASFSVDLIRIAAIMHNVNLFVVTKHTYHHMVYKADDTSYNEPSTVEVSCELTGPAKNVSADSSNHLVHTDHPNTIAILHIMVSDKVEQRFPTGSSRISCDLKSAHFEPLIDFDGYSMWNTASDVVRHALIPAACAATKTNEYNRQTDWSERNSTLNGIERKAIFEVGQLALLTPSETLMKALASQPCMPMGMIETRKMPVKIMRRMKVHKASSPGITEKPQADWYYYKLRCHSGVLDGEYYIYELQGCGAEIDPSFHDDAYDFVHVGPDVHANIDENVEETLTIRGEGRVSACDDERVSTWIAWINYLSRLACHGATEKRSAQMPQVGGPVCKHCKKGDNPKNVLILCLGCSEWMHKDRCVKPNDWTREKMHKRDFHLLQCVKNYERSVQELRQVTDLKEMRKRAKELQAEQGQ